MNKKNSLINIEFHSLLRDITKNIFIYILAFFIGFMGSYAYQGYTYKPLYGCSSIVCVNRSVGGSTTYTNVKATKQVADVLSQIFNQKALYERAAKYMPNNSFDGHIASNVIAGTNFIKIDVFSSRPDLSYNMTKAMLKAYPEITEKLLLETVVTELKAPTMPSVPSNTKITFSNYRVGIIAVLTAVLITVVLSVFRATVKDENSFYQLVDSKLIGTICHEKKSKGLKKLFKKSKESLLIYNNKRASLSFVEGYQKIATRLEYLNRSNGDSVFLITSVAENEGKSTAASNVAISLASRGNKVLLFDFDIKRPALYKIFDISKNRQSSSELSEMMSGKVDMTDYMFCRLKKSNLYMALNTKASGSYHPWMEKENVKQVIDHFRNLVDYIIIDTAPLSVDSSITNLLPVADKSILVVRTDVVYASAVNDAILTMKDVGADFAGCILNDTYSEFSLFGQAGYDESGYYNKKYGRYGYGRYGRYGKYGKYNNYNYRSVYYRYNRYSESLGLFDEDK